MRIVAVIPSYNEEHNIGSVVRCAMKYVNAVYVIDNNSTDNTVRIAKANGAAVFQEYKKGAGAATAKGWDICKAMCKIGRYPRVGEIHV
jgi:glycosyltransferase involved in cell wall biosynthesis